MTASLPKAVTVYCGELCKSNECNATTLNLLNRPLKGMDANISIGYEKFVKDPEALSPRLCSHEIEAQRKIHLIWIAARNDAVFFAYLVAIPRHRFK